VDSTSGKCRNEPNVPEINVKSILQYELAMAVGATFVIVVTCAAVLARAATGDPPGDLRVVRERLVRSILPSDPAAIDEIGRSASRLAALLRDDGSWGDIDYADQARSDWRAKEHLDRLLLMSRAHRIAPDEKRLDAIRRALDFWLDRDFHNPNWWHDQIGTPQLLSTTGVFLHDELSPRQREKIGQILRRSTWEKWVGQNLVWGVTNQVKRALVEDDAEAMTQAYQRLYQELRIATAEGIQRDYSFHQHGAQLYNGGYGLNFATDVTRYAALAWGTRWQIPRDRMDLLLAYLLDGQQWMMRGGRIDYSTVGREITRKGKTAVPRAWTNGPVSPIGAAYGLPQAIALLGGQDVPRREELAAFASRLNGRPAHDRALVGNRHFWRSDYHVHHRPGWFASIKMFSARTINAELINAEGTKSQHLSDGANFLYRTGDEYVEIFPVWDWTKVPGTTAVQGTLDIEEGKEIGVKGRTSFVGGVSDGACGLAAMHLARGKLAARKSWFFFDDGCVALGAGITCTGENPVATGVNQCHLDGDVSKGSNWLHHANVGYVFEPASRVQLTTGEQTGRWSDIGTGSDDLLKQKVFNLWLDHGVHPLDATYQYTVLPGATRDETSAYAKKPTAKTITNTPAQQAVWNEESRVLAVAFWEAGAVEREGHTLEVDRPCLVLLNLSENRPRVEVSNPLNEPATVTITFDGVATTVELPDGEVAGSSVLQHLAGR
jgi:chondroitin AC lyase